MAGIYIHIPFCKKACHYCNFHFSTSLQLTNDFLLALLKEIDLQQEYLGKEPIETIYLGGGTPSILPPAAIQRILDKVKESFLVKPGIEITLEANPDDIAESSAKDWIKTGINRLSIGIQSFHEADLQWMNRSHSALQARHSIKIIKDAGFENYSIDLIYGSPTTGDEIWKQNVDQAISLGTPHLSCYALTVEPRTALHNFIQRKKYPAIDNEQQARQFELLMLWMKEGGYEHYEISNFCLPGKRSLHNSSYWQGKKYLGLGPSAHSYDGHTRQWNIANNALYIQSINLGKLPFEKEMLTRAQSINEYIMTSLRTLEGLSLSHIRNEFGEPAVQQLLDGCTLLMKEEKMMQKEDRLILRNEGKLLADGIAAKLFFAEGSV